MKIHISIVDFFKAPRLIESLKALEQQSLFEHCQVTVFDNSVNEENFVRLNEYIKNKKNIVLVRSSFNQGYTKATNLSVDFSADYVVLLNPDLILSSENCIKDSIEALQRHKKLGLLGIKQVDDHGNVELVARTYPSIKSQLARRAPWFVSRLYRAERESYECAEVNCQASGVHIVDWVQSSFWVVKGELWRELNGVCEDFFLFMSEAEFSLRAKKIGYLTALNCNTYAISDGVRASAGGLKAIFKSKAFRSHVCDMAIYYLKNISISKRTLP
jgi:GT2 family glycosyltransferase